MLKAIQQLLDNIIAGWKKDAENKQQKIPQDFRTEITNKFARIWGASWFKFLVFGRPPGKQPPPTAMTEFVKKNPNILVDARKMFKKITEQSLGYLIGRKIGAKGSRIFRGEKPGIDYEGVIKINLKEMYGELAKAYTLEVVNKLKLK